MSRQYASQLQLDIKPSKIYRYLILILSSFILLSILIVDINSLTIKLFLIILLAIAVVFAFNNNRSVQLLCQSDGSWLISRGETPTNNFSRSDQYHRAGLREGSVVTAFLTVLNFKLENAYPVNIVLFKDSLTEEAFRKLRVKLKVEGIATSTRDTL